MSRGAARSGPLRTETGPLDLAMEALMWGTERADGTFKEISRNAVTDRTVSPKFNVEP